MYTGLARSGYSEEHQARFDTESQPAGWDLCHHFERLLKAGEGFFRTALLEQHAAERPARMSEVRVCLEGGAQSLRPPRPIAASGKGNRPPRYGQWVTADRGAAPGAARALRNPDHPQMNTYIVATLQLCLLFYTSVEAVGKCFAVWPVFCRPPRNHSLTSSPFPDPFRCPFWQLSY